MTITFLGLLVFSAVSAVGGLLIGKWIWEKDEVLDIIDKYIQNTCDRCGKIINHYGLCEECDKWLEANYGEGKKNV